MAENPATSEPYVFLSYASADRNRVLDVADTLETAGITVWVDRRDIAGGSSWDTSIVHAISGCTVFVLTCSPASLASPNVQQEVRLAWEERRPIVPLLLETVAIPADLRYPLAGRQWVEVLERPAESWLPDVLRALAGPGIIPRTPTEAPDRRTARAAVPAIEPPLLHLPSPRTSFLGREQELTQIAGLLATTGLLTLTGPGGTGKTRLAIAAARQVADGFADGVWFVDLSAVTDPAGVLPAIAALLDVRESEGRSLAVSLAAYLRRKRLLLVLDNLEQVVAAALSLYDLLAEAPGLTMLVTSRVLLHLEGEREYAVPPLPLPEVNVAVLPEQLGAFAAVQLFVERAQALRPDFRLHSENAAVVAAISRRLDGLPLAIELAAARVKLLPPVQLLARLEQRLAFLTGGERNRPSRQQTLRNTIQWSWDLLSEAEQVLFRRLGVFAGGFTIEAAEAVCNAGGELDVFEGLAALVGQSLVRQLELNNEVRFNLLATLQEFALEQLESSGEITAVRRAHAEYYCTVAEAADADWWVRGWAQQGLLLLNADEDNLLAALSWALAEQDQVLGLRLGSALGIWFFLHAPAAGQQWLKRLRGIPGAEEPGRALGRTLFGEYVCAAARGEMQVALARLEEAAACQRRVEDLPGLSRSLAYLTLMLATTETERVQAIADEALALARALDNPLELAFVEVPLAYPMRFHGRSPAQLREYLEEALQVTRAVKADWLTMTGAYCLAEITEDQQAATELWCEALPVAEALGDRLNAGIIRSSLAVLACRTGDFTAAATHWRQALAWAQELSSEVFTAYCLAGIAGLMTAEQRLEPAVQLLAASERLQEEAAQSPFYGPRFQAVYRESQAATEAALDTEAYKRTWASGLALSLDQAADLALAQLIRIAPTEAELYTGTS